MSIMSLVTFEATAYRCVVLPLIDWLSDDAHFTSLQDHGDTTANLQISAQELLDGLLGSGPCVPYYLFPEPT